MSEGSLDAPTRHPIAWQDEEYYDEAALDGELRRVFDICHGCRRCFNLCDSFPRLFDMIDESPGEDVESLRSEQFKPVIDACTLCDMCFMTKCPYVPPHPFNLDFPHLMLRARAIEHRNGKTSFADKQLAETDRNGKLGTTLSEVVNWASRESNALTRGAMKMALGVDRKAHLPEYADIPLTIRTAADIPAPNPQAPAFGRKAAIYATCFGEFNEQTTGLAAIKLLAHNGVALRVEHPMCCGMPKLENGDLASVAKSAEQVAAFFGPIIDQGYDIVPLTPSCTLMLKFEWPLLLPGNAAVEKLSKAVFDLSEYVVDIAKRQGLVPIAEMATSVAVHLACHSRAQNMGPKAVEMLKLIPGAKPVMVERCSGHGGKWGIMEQNFETAVKHARPTARALAKADTDYVVSECPLAGPHLRQVMAATGGDATPERVGHPIEIMARAYGF